VLVDADWDPPAKPLNGRLAAAAAGLLVALGGGAAWLGISSIPASPPSREPVASAPAPATGVPPMAPSASSDTFLPPARDAAPRRLRVERDGYRPYDRVIDVASGQRLRITDITLAER